MTGATGAQGPIGSTGLTGAAGATGATGAQGLIGLTGATGATGAQGVDGTNGLNGVDGIGLGQGSYLILATNAVPPAGFTLLGTTVVDYKYKVLVKNKLTTKTATKTLNLYEKN